MDRGHGAAIRLSRCDSPRQASALVMTASLSPVLSRRRFESRSATCGTLSRHAAGRDLSVKSWIDWRSHHLEVWCFVDSLLWYRAQFQ